MRLLPPVHQLLEVEIGIEMIRKLHSKMLLFSYPFGSENVWGDDTVSQLSQSGVTAAFTMGRRLATQSDINKQFFIPRYSVTDVFDHDNNLMIAEML